MTPIGRHEADWEGLAGSALREALAAATSRRIAAVYLSAFAPGPLCGIRDPAGRIAKILAADGQCADVGVHGPFLTGGHALYRALADLDTGAIDGDALVIGVEKMTHRSAAEASELLAPRVVHTVEQTHGATLPALAALATTAYTREARVPQAAFDDVAVKSHDHASRNPLAHFQRPITRSDVAHSPLVADPLRRFHCAPMSDGASACVIGTDASPGNGIAVRGWAHGRDASIFHERHNLARFDAAARAAHAAFAMAKRTPRDVHMVEIHDAFSPFELMNLEALGFFDRGDAWRALVRGQLHSGGILAVNPSGGMKARGHPIGVCGLSSLFEVWQQLTGHAGGRQHPGASCAMIQSAGGVARDTFVFVVEASA